jgi:hypothetical protein
MAEPKKHTRVIDSDGDINDAEDDVADIRMASAEKNENAEVKSEVADLSTKKRKRGDDDEGEDDVKDAVIVDINDTSVRQKKKKKKEEEQAKKHACTEPGCGKYFDFPSLLIIHFRTHRRRRVWRLALIESCI